MLLLPTSDGETVFVFEFVKRVDTKSVYKDGDGAMWIGDWATEDTVFEKYFEETEPKKE
jgi:hypothetical protein